MLIRDYGETDCAFCGRRIKKRSGKTQFCARPATCGAMAWFDKHERKGPRPVVTCECEGKR
jgi:hypothetical protein